MVIKEATKTFGKIVAKPTDKTRAGVPDRRGPTIITLNLIYLPMLI